jgi:predicted RND superfamily exporter protein
LAGLFLPKRALAPGEGAATQAITLVFTDRPLTGRVERDALLATVRGALGGMEGVTLTGMSVISHDGEILIRGDLPRVFLLALILVMVYLLGHFRNGKDALLTLAPTAFALVCVMALMRLTGQQLNLVNLIAAPLLIGLCVDYPIFMISLARLDRHRSGGREELMARLGSSGHAVLICSATVIVGFGSLAWTSVPAVRSLGMIVASGVGASVVATFFFLVPLLLGKRQRMRPKA